MKNRNIIIAVIVVIAIVVGGLAIWKPSSQVKELVNKTKNERGEQIDKPRMYEAKLQAKEALLKAKLASKTIDSTNQQMTEKINKAQEYIKEKNEEAGVVISNIYSKASELVKDDNQ